MQQKELIEIKGIELPDEIKQLVHEYSMNNRMNTLFFRDEELHQFFKSKYLKEYEDRFVFVSRMNRINTELIPFVHKNLHNKRVRLYNGLEGIIKHELKREFENKIYDNDVVFRWDKNGYEHDKYVCGNETIALSVIVEGDKFNSHLYTIDQMELI